MEGFPCCAPRHNPVPGDTAQSRDFRRSGGRDEEHIVWLGGGRSYCGTHRATIKGGGEEHRSVRVQPFGIDRFAVTNVRFLAFLEQTSYRTEAEVYNWSFVFKDALDPMTRASTQRVAEVPWWHKVEGANWSRPAGPMSSIDKIMDHPVVHVSWNDAVAFAGWAGGRLLTEGEWEFAARGGKDVVYPWGNEDSPEDNPHCNIWQGSFPDQNLATDGYEGTAPTSAFEPNGYGLYNMAGNTWEWCAEPFRVKSLASAGKARNAMARQEGERLLKGGSFLCHRSYCHRYRIAARMGRSPNSTTSHIGFRLGYDGR
ncbi:formylglycine-generating enzyme family protein [Mesorhizobium sp. A556]